MAWVAAHADPEARTVLDLGGRNVNGSPRPLFPAADVYRCLDIVAGAGVDIVADAGTWTPDAEYDVVLSTECFEHTENWRDVIATAHAALRPGGRFICTAAGPGRPLHSGITGEFWVQLPGEFYANVRPDHLDAALRSAGFVDVVVEQTLAPCDVHAVARKADSDG
jgi:SAM-dependent methyltransferase